MSEKNKFFNEEVRTFLYFGEPRQEIVAEIGLAKRELLKDYKIKYKEDEVMDRLQDFMR